MEHTQYVNGKSLQENYAPLSACFGCGPANSKGLHVRSFPEKDRVVAEWQPQPHHEAFPGVLNGGIIGSIMDCHSNWAAAWHLMNQSMQSEPACTVTANYSVQLLAPTPSHLLLRLEAEVTDLKTDRATIRTILLAGGKTTATCVGTFVAVKPGHPAYHRW